MMENQGISDAKKEAAGQGGQGGKKERAPAEKRTVESEARRIKPCQG
jgi:hypothetical protein